jgi:UDP-N-acetylmuramyl tripeptide synthase
LIRLDSKQIHSDGLWENVGLAIKVALDFGVNPKVIKKTVSSIKFEGRVQFIKAN